MHHHRNRKGLTSLQEEYIERITKPKTPEDVVLALQNPLSTIYKDAMNMLIAQIQMDIIIEKLIQHYLWHDFEVREQEKEELIKAMVLTEAKRNMHRDALQIPEVIQYKKSIENMNLSHAKQQWEKHSAMVSVLKEDITRYENNLLEIKETENILKQEWRRMAEETRAAYVEHLQQQNLSFVGSSGQEIAINSERGKKIIDIRSGMNSLPLEVIKAVKSSIEIAKEQNLFLPEEFREPTKDPNMLVEYQSLMDEINALGEISRDEHGNKITGARLYDLNKENKEPLKLIKKPPNLPDAPRSYTIKKSKTAEAAYMRSLLIQSKIEDEKKKPNEYKEEVILPSQGIVKQRSGYLAELSELGAEAEGKTGPELLKALREQKQKQMQKKNEEMNTGINPSNESNENRLNQNNNQNVTPRPKPQVKLKVEDDATPQVKLKVEDDSTNSKLDTINSRQVRLMGNSLALLDTQTEIKHKLNHAKVNLEFAEKLVVEDIKQCNKLISGQAKNDEHIEANVSAKQKNNF